LILLALAFLLNRQVLNEILCMKALVFIGIFPYGFGLKQLGFFLQPTRKIQQRAVFFQNHNIKLVLSVPHALFVASSPSTNFFSFSLSFLLFSYYRLVLGLEIEVLQLVCLQKSLESSFHIFHFL